MSGWPWFGRPWSVPYPRAPLAARNGQQNGANVVKSYRSRNLTQKCQVAKDDGTGNPLRDEKGNPVLDHNGLWFLKVSGAENHDRKRLIPDDWKAFFAHKAREIEEALRADGVADASVSVDDVYAEFAATFTKAAHTYAPPGQPEEFSLVLPKNLCVNWRGASPSGPNGARVATTVAPQHTSVFARIKAMAAAARESTAAATAAPTGAKKAK